MTDSLVQSTGAYNCAKCVALLLGACVPTASIVVLVPKSSALVRYAWVVILIAVGKRLAESIFDIGPEFGYLPAAQMFALLILIQCCNFLITIRLDLEDLVQGNIFTRSDGFVLQVMKTLGLLFNLRGIGTPWQISRVNGFPSFYKNEQKKPSRTRYLVRQMLIISWQYTFLDAMYAASMTPEDTEKLFGDGKEFKYFSATREEWKGRIMSSLMFWLVMARTSIDILNRTASFVCVLFGISTPEDWPPLFGGVLDAYTLRGFWSHFWHQYFRWALTSMSNFICRDLLRLSHPSFLERYLNIFIVFLASGVAHALNDLYSSPPVSGQIPTVAFFSCFALEIMIEDGVQELCRRMTGVDTRNGKAPLWHKVVGYFWVLSCLIVGSPWYIYPHARTSMEGKWFLPISLVDSVGNTILWAWIIASGLILKSKFHVEL